MVFVFVEYDDLDDFIYCLKLGIMVSELYGLLSGFLVGGGWIGWQLLLVVLYLDGEVLNFMLVDVVVLECLLWQVVDQFVDLELGFELMLLEDDCLLVECVEVIVEWCCGFFGGFGLVGLEFYVCLFEEVQEVLCDLGIIVLLQFDFGSEDEDEDLLIEVYEFVWVGVMLLYVECVCDLVVGNDILY